MQIPHPRPQSFHVSPLFFKQNIQRYPAFQKPRNVRRHIGIFTDYCRRVHQPRVSVMAHDKLHLWMLCRRLIQTEGMAVFQIRGSHRRFPCMNCHRLSIGFRQFINRLVNRIAYINRRIARIQLDSHTLRSLQILFQSLDGLRNIIFCQVKAIHSNAVTQKIRISMILRIHRPVSHHNSAYNSKLFVCLFQMLRVIFMARCQRQICKSVLLRPKMQMRVDDLHKSFPFVFSLQYTPFLHEKKEDA